MNDSARSVALSALLRVEVDEGYSNLVLDKALAASTLEPRDKALASAIFYGVLERRITLDYIIGQFSKTPIHKISPKVLEILRMGVYQILYLEKVPKSAAVNECVKLVKENNFAKASGFTNAILRSLIRENCKVQMPNPEKQPVQYLSVKYSCPEWLVSLWQTAYGEQHTLGLLESTMNKPPVFARVNNTLISEEDLLNKLGMEGMTAKPVSWLDFAVQLDNTGAISSSSSFQSGLFHIQDLSSQLCCSLLNPAAGKG